MRIANSMLWLAAALAGVCLPPAALGQNPPRPNLPPPPGLRQPPSQPPPAPSPKAACPVRILNARLLGGAGGTMPVSSSPSDLEHRAKRLQVTAVNQSNEDVTGFTLKATLVPAGDLPPGAHPAPVPVSEQWKGMLMPGRHITLTWPLDLPRAHTMKLARAWISRAQFAGGSLWLHAEGDGCVYNAGGRMLRPVAETRQDPR